MEERCSHCGAPRREGAMFCSKCGQKFVTEKRCPNCKKVVDPDAVFCSYCGYRLVEELPKEDTVVIPEHDETIEVKEAEQPVEEIVPTSPPVPTQPKKVVQVQPERQASYNLPPVKPKKSNMGLIIGLVAVFVVLIGAAVFGVMTFLKSKVPVTPVSEMDDPDIANEESAEPELKYDYKAVPVVFPAIYRSMDYIVYFEGYSSEPREVVLTVEVPSYTQKYEQKIMLEPQLLKLKIKPPLLEGVLDTLNTSKEAQINITLQDVETQKYYIQDSKPVNFLSKYDIQWSNEDGTESYYEHACAWITPEAPMIKELLRNSINTLSYWSGGAINEIVGYQSIGGLSASDISFYQTAAIFETLRNTYYVRYNATPVTTSGNGAQQRIALPEDVIQQGSGLCIETAVTMASAIEATGMHPMLLILPGHAQVAVETWKDSGEYYLIETTALTEPNWDNIIFYLTKEEWVNYLANNQVIVIDVELARKDGIKPMK